MKIVHHIIAFADNRGVAPDIDAKTPDTPGFPCGMGRDGSESLQRVVGIDSMLGGWAPGTPPIFYQDGVGKLLAKGSNIILQMHYFNQTESEQTDLSGIGFHYADTTIQRRMRAMPVMRGRARGRSPHVRPAARTRWSDLRHKFSASPPQANHKIRLSSPASAAPRGAGAHLNNWRAKHAGAARG